MDALLHDARATSQDAPWRAFLGLGISERNGKSSVTHVEHQGPLRIQRAFYPEETGTAHIYLLHPPGGVAGGDQLRLEVEVGPEARCLLTAPAAAKLYRTSERKSEVSQWLTVREGGVMEWLPQETIAFSGARCRLSTFVHLEPGARFIGWEITCLGRPAAGEAFDSGQLDQRFEVWRDEEPIYVDRLLVGDESEAQAAVWGLDGQCVLGTLLIAAEAGGLVELIRGVLAASPMWSENAACTELDGVVTVRHIGPSARECWKLFVKVWEAVRPAALGAEAVCPRIWSY